jgi:hypothetical protein
MSSRSQARPSYLPEDACQYVLLRIALGSLDVYIMPPLFDLPALSSCYISRSGPHASKGFLMAS